MRRELKDRWDVVSGEGDAEESHEERIESGRRRSLGATGSSLWNLMRRELKDKLAFGEQSFKAEARIS